MAEEVKRLENWKKFPLPEDATRTIRAMLNLQPWDEIPEKVWMMLALHKAMTVGFPERPWESHSIYSLILAAEAYQAPHSNVRYVPGKKVMVKTVGREGTYWFVAPFGRHLVNCDGDVFLAKTEDLEASEEAIADSDLNKQAAVGAKVMAKVEGSKNKPANAV